MMTFDEWHAEQMHGDDKPCPHEKHERFAWYACMLELHKAIAWDRQWMTECKCDMRTRLVGDGCAGCNPAMAMDIERDNALDRRKGQWEP